MRRPLEEKEGQGQGAHELRTLKQLGLPLEPALDIESGPYEDVRSR